MSDLTDLVEERPAGPLSVPSALLGAAVFVAVLVAGAALLGRALPPYLQNPHLRAKLEHLAAHGDRYDTLFIGSSRVYRQVSPAVFDATTAAAGMPTSSFNFGAGGMRGMEVEFVLEQVLALPSVDLRWVWIEPGDPAQRYPAVNRRSERFTAWHGLRSTWRALDLWLGGERAGYDWRSWSQEHLPAMALRVLQVGRMRDRLRLDPEPETLHLGHDGDGFFALDWSERPAVEKRRTRFVGSPETFREKLRNLSEVRGVERPLEPFELRFLARLRDRVERTGATPLFLIPPAMTTRGDYVALAAEQGHLPVTFSYVDPERYPEFYRMEVRFDAGHLNLEGAELFSRHLAEDFVDHARRQQPPEPTRLAGEAQNWK